MSLKNYLIPISRVCVYTLYVCVLHQLSQQTISNNQSTSFETLTLGQSQYMF